MLGNISGAMGGVPQTLPASMSALCLRSASRVSDVAMMSPSSNAALPAM